MGTNDLYGTSSTSQWFSVLSGASFPASASFIVSNVVDFQLVFYACPAVSSTGTASLTTTPVKIYSTADAASVTTSPNYHLPIRLTNMGTFISTTAPTSALTASLQNGIDVTNTVHGPVVYADVTITVLDNNGAVQLGSGAITLAEAKARYGHNLTRRVTIPEPF